MQASPSQKPRFEQKLAQRGRGAAASVESARSIAPAASAAASFRRRKPFTSLLFVVCLPNSEGLLSTRLGVDVKKPPQILERRRRRPAQPDRAPPREAPQKLLFAPKIVPAALRPPLAAARGGGVGEVAAAGVRGGRDAALAVAKVVGAALRHRRAEAVRAHRLAERECHHDGEEAGAREDGGAQLGERARALDDRRARARHRIVGNVRPARASPRRVAVDDHRRVGSLAAALAATLALGEVRAVAQVAEGQQRDDAQRRAPADVGFEARRRRRVDAEHEVRAVDLGAERRAEQRGGAADHRAPPLAGRRRQDLRMEAALAAEAGRAVLLARDCRLPREYVAAIFGEERRGRRRWVEVEEGGREGEAGGGGGARGRAQHIQKLLLNQSFTAAGLLPTRGDARISMGMCPEGVWGGSGAILSSIGRL